MRSIFTLLFTLFTLTILAQTTRSTAPAALPDTPTSLAAPRHTAPTLWTASVAAGTTTAATINKAPRKADYDKEVVGNGGVILEPAAGEEKTYERSGTALLYNYSTEQSVPSEQGGGLTLVECPDGTVYMKQPLSSYGMGMAGDAWIKGHREGNTLTFPGSQPINYVSMFGEETTVSVCYGRYDAKAWKYYNVDRNAPIVFTEMNNGRALYLENTDEENIIGAFWDDTDEFTGYGDHSTYLTINAEAFEEELVAAPEGLECTDYILSANKNGEPIDYYVSLGFDGDDVYLKGFSLYAEEKWIKGYRENGRIVFPYAQYIGKDAGFNLYVYGATLAGSGAQIADLYFNYNAKTDSYTLSTGLLVSRGKVTSNIVVAEYLTNVRIYPIGQEDPNDVEIRYDVPEGQHLTYSRTGGSYYTFYGYILDARQEGKQIDIVTAPDGRTVYMMNPISQAITEPGAWVEGTIGDDGKIHMPLGQPIYKDPDTGYIMLTAALRLTLVDNTLNYVVDYDYDEVTFTIADDGSIALDPMTDVVIYEGYPSMVYGLIYADDRTWTGYADYDSRYIPFDDDITTIPATLHSQKWALMYNDGTNDEAVEVQVAIDGSTIYIAGLNDNVPKAAIVGSIAGSKATFASDQFIGQSPYERMLYFVAANYEDHTAYDEEFDYTYTYHTYDYLPEISLDYDAAARTLRTTGDVAILVNQGFGFTGAFTPVIVALRPYFQCFEETAATPATPSVVDYGIFFDEYSFDVAEFHIPTRDVDDNYMDTAKLFYTIWTKQNGTAEPLVITPEEYEGLDRQYTEVPYDLAVTSPEGWNSIVAGGKRIVLFHTGYDNIGIQSIYYGGGERRTSPIAWWTDTEGISLPAADASQAPTIFSLDGRRITSAHHGVGIYRDTQGRTRKIVR